MYECENGCYSPGHKARRINQKIRKNTGHSMVGMYTLGYIIKDITVLQAHSLGTIPHRCAPVKINHCSVSWNEA